MCFLKEESVLFAYACVFFLVLRHRYAKKEAWEQFFTQLLNIESCEKMPDLAKLRNVMEETLAKIPEVQAKFRSFVNVLNKR